MKAIHVANVGPKQLYFLLESDNGYDGALVGGNEPEKYVNFFEYVGNKRSVEQLTNSKFLRFFWTGHYGPLADRWEQNFIDQVIEPSKLLLDGVTILTKFNSTRPPNRAEHLKMQSNRALEYKGLINSGLNEKAFMTRGTRGIGRSIAHGSQRAATAGIRGFRRGVRFDPNAEDADGDGFVQEGTQHARRAQRVAREVANIESVGFRSTTRPYMRPPRDPPSHQDRRYAEISESLMGSTDPATIIQSFKDMYDALTLRLGEVRRDLKIEDIKAKIDDLKKQMNLRLEVWNDQDKADLLGAEIHKLETEIYELGAGVAKPAQIKTRKDAMELASAIHPFWAAGGVGMEFDLLDLPDDHQYTEHQKWAIVAVFTALSNPDTHSQRVEILADRSRPKRTYAKDGNGNDIIGLDGLPQVGPHPDQRDIAPPYMELHDEQLDQVTAFVEMLRSLPVEQQIAAWGSPLTDKDAREAIASHMFDLYPRGQPMGIENNDEGHFWSYQKLTDKLEEFKQLRQTDGLSPDMQKRIKVAEDADKREILMEIIPNLRDYGLSSKDILDDLEASGIELEHIRLIDVDDRAFTKIVGEELIVNIGELITLNESHPEKKTNGIQVSYMSEAHIRRYGQPYGYTEFPWARYGVREPPARYRFTFADAVYHTLMTDESRMFPDLKRAARERAAAMANAAILFHEMGGHGQHDMLVFEHALRATGETDRDEQMRKLFTTALDELTTQLSANDKLIGYTLDADTLEKLADSRSSIMNIVFGLSIEIEDHRSPDGTSLLRPAQKGIHGLLYESAKELQGPDDRGTSTARQLKTWLQKPVLDSNGNPYAATAGLVRYFEKLSEAAKNEWDIDLTLSEGEQLTLGHVLFGMWPTENGIAAMSLSMTTAHRKGRWSGAAGRPATLPQKTVTTIQPSNAPPGFQLPPGKMKRRNGTDDHTDNFTLGDTHEAMQAVPGPIPGTTVPTLKRSDVPNVVALRNKGIPALDITEIWQPGNSIKTEEVSASDAAPLLDAFARVTQEIHRVKIDHKEKDEQKFVDAVTEITFDNNDPGGMLDDEVGIVRLPYREFLDGKASDPNLKEQASRMREDIARTVVSQYAVSSMWQSTGDRVRGWEGGGPTSRIVGVATPPSEVPILSNDPAAQQAEHKLRENGLGNLVGNTLRTAFHWGPISPNDQKILGNLADSMGKGDYASYAASLAAHTPLKGMAGANRYESITELLGLMTFGVEFPIYNADGTRRSLTLSEVHALKNLFKWFYPSMEPRIYSAGERHE